MMLLLLLAACTGASDSDSKAGPKACTEIGCHNQVTLRVVDSLDVYLPDMAGTVVVGAASFDVDCTAGGTSDAEVTCESDGIVIVVPDIAVGEQVIVELSNPDGSATATATLDPEWVEVRPNGPECPPTCGQAEVGVVIDQAG